MHHNWYITVTATGMLIYTVCIQQLNNTGIEKQPTAWFHMRAAIFTF